jgi:hypothetical protein
MIIQQITCVKEKTAWKMVRVQFWLGYRQSHKATTFVGYLFCSLSAFKYKTAIRINTGAGGVFLSAGRQRQYRVESEGVS